MQKNVPLLPDQEYFVYVSLRTRLSLRFLSRLCGEELENEELYKLGLREARCASVPASCRVPTTLWICWRASMRRKKDVQAWQWLDRPRAEEMAGRRTRPIVPCG